MQVAEPTPHAPGRLLAVRPDVAKLLAVVALGESILGLVCFYLHGVLMQVAEPIPHAAGRLLAVGPDVANLLAVVALGEGILGLVCLYLHGDVAEAGELEDFWGFCCPWKGDKEQRKVYVFGPIRGPADG
jgi:hypothetical protein